MAVAKLRNGQPRGEKSIDSSQSSLHHVKPIHSGVLGGCPIRVCNAKSHSSKACFARSRVFFDVHPYFFITSKPGYKRPLLRPVYWDIRSSISAFADAGSDRNFEDSRTSWGSAWKSNGSLPFL